MKRLCVVIACIIALTSVSAQDEEQTSGAPQLTSVQKTELDGVLLRIEVAQLRLQNAELNYRIAQLGLESERAVAQIALKNLEVPGWRLDIVKKVYVATPALEKK